MLESRPCAMQSMGCTEPCPSSHLMCVLHWRMVPAALRVMVRTAYQVWRRSVSGNRPTEMKIQRAAELRKAQSMAIAAVTEKLIRKDLDRQEGQEPLFAK